ncbi:hypothetical protein [Mycobacterium sp. C31M]
MSPDRPGLRPDDPEVRSAARFALIAGVLGVAFLVLAAVLVRSCDEAVVDTAACGRPERLVLALGAPILLFVAGVRAFVRTYRLWQVRQTWWAWQGAGWFLMLLMLVVLTMGLPTLGGFGS